MKVEKELSETNLKVEKGIPIPSLRRWDFAQLEEVGDSIFLTAKEIGIIRSAVEIYKRDNPTFNYMSRRVKGGFRLWRIEVEDDKGDLL